MMNGRMRVVLGLVLLLVLSAGAPGHANEAVTSLVGRDAPRFESLDGEGKPVALSQLLGGKSAVLLNFWGLRCGACIEEIPHLNGIFRKYAGAGLKILGVNVDGLPGDKVKAQAEAIGIKMDYPWIPDPDFKVIDLYKMEGAPLNVIIDVSGKVTYYHEGFEAGGEAAIEAEVRKVLPPSSATR